MLSPLATHVLPESDTKHAALAHWAGPMPDSWRQSHTAATTLPSLEPPDCSRSGGTQCFTLPQATNYPPYLGQQPQQQNRLVPSRKLHVAPCIPCPCSSPGRLHSAQPGPWHSGWQAPQPRCLPASLRPLLMHSWPGPCLCHVRPEILHTDGELEGEQNDVCQESHEGSSCRATWKLNCQPVHGCLDALVHELLPW